MTVVQPGAFSNLIHLEDLLLDNNQLASIQSGTFSNLPKLRDLVVRQNHLSSIQPGSFSNLPSLKVLSLVDNKLTDIPPGVFSNVPKLERLYLSVNHLTNINPNSFSNLKLRILDFSENRIANIEPNTFSKIPTLEELDIDSNQITNIMPGAFANLPQLQWLQLDSNQITSIHSGTFSNLPKLSRLHLHNNPWQCDCRMVAFGLSIAMSNVLEEPIICEEPNKFRGVKLQHIKPRNLICEKPTVVGFQRSKDSTLQRGRALHLVCKSSGIPKPDITVILPSGRNATVESDGRVTVHNNGTIITADISTADFGLYVCTVKNAVGSSFAKLFVEIEIPTTEMSTSSTLGSTNSPIAKGSTYASTNSFGSTPTTLSAERKVSVVSRSAKLSVDIKGPSSFPSKLSSPVTFPPDKTEGNADPIVFSLSVGFGTFATILIISGFVLTLFRCNTKKPPLVPAPTPNPNPMNTTITCGKDSLNGKGGYQPQASSDNTHCSAGTNNQASIYDNTNENENREETGTFEQANINENDNVEGTTLRGAVGATTRSQIEWVCVLNPVTVHKSFTYENTDEETVPVDVEEHVYENDDEKTVACTSQAINQHVGKEAIATTRLNHECGNQELAATSRYNREHGTEDWAALNTSSQFIYGNDNEEAGSTAPPAIYKNIARQENSAALNIIYGNDDDHIAIFTPSQFNSESDYEAESVSYAPSQFMYENDSEEAVSHAIYNNSHQAQSAASQIIYGDDYGKAADNAPRYVYENNDI
ncbi:leucine-rich repeat-containing protein 4-like [Branchiostoma lanceolatum]|uniref:leucine-rich repeat-containing protein 4-like n=1 Tax=Branchiostoma lanceolatum TaxID=7740 RepID=UPI003452EAB9